MKTVVEEKEKTLFPLLENEMERLADDSGIKLELVNGIPIWEAFPGFQHQEKSLGIQISLREKARRSHSCPCISVADLTIRFPDGFIKRPDISIFCNRPIEQKTVCTLIPEAVIEILSRGYEKKDTEVSLPFYFAWNIPDIALFNPETNRVSHYHEGQVDEYDSPVELTFTCGSRAAI